MPRHVVICYLFTRIHFGLTCSHFPLSVRELVAIHKDTFPTAAMLVDRSTFIDIFVAGAECDNDVIALYYQLNALMRKYNFPMVKRTSNSEPLKDIWKAGGLEIKSIAQFLGVSWDNTRIHFSQIK